MNTLTEYRLQTIGGVVMTFLGFVQWAIGGFFLKFVSGGTTDPANSLAMFVRQAGILALALPLAWAVFSIQKERNQTNRWTQKYTLFSGLLVAWAMFYLLGKSVTYGRTYLW